MKERLRRMPDRQLQRVARAADIPLSRLALWINDQAALTAEQMNAVEVALGDLEVAQSEAERVFGK